MSPASSCTASMRRRVRADMLRGDRTRNDISNHAVSDHFTLQYIPFVLYMKYNSFGF